jgi:hypothetical protein
MAEFLQQLTVLSIVIEFEPLDGIHRDQIIGWLNDHKACVESGHIFLTDPTLLNENEGLRKVAVVVMVRNLVRAEMFQRFPCHPIDHQELPPEAILGGKEDGKQHAIQG